MKSKFVYDLFISTKEELLDVFRFFNTFVLSK